MHEDSIIMLGAGSVKALDQIALGPKSPHRPKRHYLPVDQLYRDPTRYVTFSRQSFKRHQ